MVRLRFWVLASTVVVAAGCDALLRPDEFSLRPTTETLAVGAAHVCAITAAGLTACWGEGSGGQLGTGGTDDALQATAIANDPGFVSLAAADDHTCGITALGALYCWGNNLQSELGDGTTEQRLTPTLVPGLTDVVAVSASSWGTCAVVKDGRAYCWGLRVRDGPDTVISTPAQVASDRPYVSVTTRSYHSCFVRRDAAVDCVGSNVVGLLGTSGPSEYVTPSRVPSLPAMRYVVTTSDVQRNLGLSMDGRVYIWGMEIWAGDSVIVGGTYGDPPERVRDIRGARTVAMGGSHYCYAAADGAGFCAGGNQEGQLGDGSMIARPEPVAIAFGLRFSVLRAGGQFTCGLTLSDELWCWGRNNSGQLGNLSRERNTFPTPIGLGPLKFRQPGSF